MDDSLWGLLAPDVGGDTLIDGVLVEHVSGKLIFTINDVITYNGHNVGRERFSVRTRQIDSVMQRLARYSGCFGFTNKRFCDAKDFQHQLLQFYYQHENLHYYNYQMKRFHQTNGFIFTPKRESYQQEHAFLWTFPNQQTVILEVETRYNQRAGKEVFTFRTGDYPIPATVRKDVCLSPEDTNALSRINARRRTSIVEMVYVPQTGRWKLVRERTDRITPDPICKVIDTMEAICENVPIEELFRLLRPGIPDPVIPHRNAFDYVQHR